MKKLIITSSMLFAASCFASVRAGPNNTYTVDNYGSDFKQQSKIQYVEECQARQCEAFKANTANTPVAIF